MCVGGVGWGVEGQGSLARGALVEGWLRRGAWTEPPNPRGGGGGAGTAPPTPRPPPPPLTHPPTHLVAHHPPAPQRRVQLVSYSGSSGGGGDAAGLGDAHRPGALGEVGAAVACLVQELGDLQVSSKGWAGHRAFKCLPACVNRPPARPPNDQPTHPAHPPCTPTCVVLPQPVSPHSTITSW